MTRSGADVLLAEDNPSDAELILETLGEVVDPGRLCRVHDGVEAMEFLARAEQEALPLSLVLLDIKLPRVDGLQVLMQLRSTPRGRLVPVVMLTSSRIARDVAAAYDLGTNGYVQKPVDFGRFREVIRCVGRFWLTINEAPARDGDSA